MNYGKQGVEINDVELESINAANAFDDFNAFLMGACAAALSPIVAITAEIIEPGSAKKHFDDIFSGKFL